jgi:hypothetical protein
VNDQTDSKDQKKVSLKLEMARNHAGEDCKAGQTIQVTEGQAKIIRDQEAAAKKAQEVNDG